MVDVICPPPPLSISSIVVSSWLAGCLAKSTLMGWREYYGGGGVGVDRHLCGAQQTGGFDPMLFQYWPTANGAGPTLKQRWVKSSCLLGELSAFWYTVPSVSGWNRLHSALCTVNHTWHMLNKTGWFSDSVQWETSSFSSSSSSTSSSSSSSSIFDKV